MYDRRRRTHLSRCLADAFLAGAWDEGALVARLEDVLTHRPGWARRLAREVIRSYHRPPRDRPRELAGFIALTLESWPAPTGGALPRVRRWLLPELAMGRRRWPVPELDSVRAVADFLELSPGHLDWLADARGLERTVKAGKLRNYSYTWLPREHRPPRVIERPKPRLKAAQRRLLHELLDWIPAHDAAHGFTRGRSARSHAAVHVGRLVILRLDLEDFFASVPAARVFGIFRTAGYPEPVAHTLTALSTNAVPVAEWGALPRPTAPSQVGAHHRLGRRLATPHLPQGAPTSPALANLALFALDRRLTGLAATVGAGYSRYADDLTFSGSRELLRCAAGVRATVAAIAREEGFAVNHQKSTLTTRAGRQRVCGIVVNERPNVARAEYDELKAILHNAARRGPRGQNRGQIRNFRAHLLGRVAWVESLHPVRGARLRRDFARIDWEA
ncbi:MAG: reverse transcriptase family protein [Actinomycetota bacterium]|nr:reverse transcriptase family protein [Actinomycetota bacterium]